MSCQSKSVPWISQPSWTLMPCSSERPGSQRRRRRKGGGRRRGSWFRCGTKLSGGVTRAVATLQRYECNLSFFFFTPFHSPPLHSAVPALLSYSYCYPVNKCPATCYSYLPPPPVSCVLPSGPPL